MRYLPTFALLLASPSGKRVDSDSSSKRGVSVPTLNPLSTPPDCYHEASILPSPNLNKPIYEVPLMNNVTTSPDGDTNSTRRTPWIDRLGSTLVLLTVVLLASCSGGRGTTVQDREAALATTVAASSDYVWVELGPDGVILARAVITQGSCPKIKLGATTHTMQPRTRHRPPSC